MLIRPFLSKCAILCLSTGVSAQTTLYPSSMPSACVNPGVPMPSQPCLPPAQSGKPPPVHLVAVRGSGQPADIDQQESDMLVISKAVIKAAPGSTSVGLNYPDSRPSLECYLPSEYAGVTNLTNYLQAYNQRCPNDHIVLMGSSQGAAVVGDTICGRTNAGVWTWPLGPRKLLAKIAAVVVFGDPTRNAGLEPASWNRGTAKKSYSKGFAVNGTIPRWPATCPAHYRTRLASYCSAGDYYCDSAYGTKGNTSLALSIHKAEVATHTPDAIQFILETIPQE